jgi:RHS repeat-associated protein
VQASVEFASWSGETTRSWQQGQQPQRYTTYLRDGNESDEAQMRRYNRWWSRFDQPDPFDGSYRLADPQSLNRYSYVQNDPVNFVDPTGLDLEPEFVTVVDTVNNRIWHALESLMLGRREIDRVRESPVETQNPFPPSISVPNTGNVQLPPPSGLCDAKLSALFGGVAASVFEPPGVRDGGRYYIKHLASNGTIHTYTNGQGTPATVGLYTPANGTFVSRAGPYEETYPDGTGRGTFSNQVKYSYAGGLEITFFHVGNVPRGANIPRTNAAGSTLIGTIGGPGGTGINYNHTHIQFDVKGVRTDPRTIYCK